MYNMPRKADFVAPKGKYKDKCILSVATRYWLQFEELPSCSNLNNNCACFFKGYFTIVILNT